MLKKIIFIKNLSKAYALASQNEIVNAISFLDKNIKNIKKYQHKFPDFFILYGDLSYLNHDYSQAKKYLHIATELLVEDTNFSLDEKMYLYAYIYNILANIAYKEKDNFWKEYDVLSKRDNFDLNKIRKTLKINFPLQQDK